MMTAPASIVILGWFMLASLTAMVLFLVACAVGAITYGIDHDIDFGFDDEPAFPSNCTLLADYPRDAA